ncbi:energy-coupling factor transporter transmembrane component T family protein [Streptomyces tsukubensis]|uniref:Cobalt ABC transporter n=1 Tax=Streptomyces tsukubensis TaxID=83656 RepID=A0A1V4AGV1_9ACTN|nr:energy-coupling factor transporter transmembrane protein EcfT [Streptomyces tsukubensis]OON82908.1 cobalt ABC transporter [Streptomyces tsukubensis]QFR91906.1 energy-coupling factor transporter transmembrane protein EcfT [Streptomyces tsukubensis]
MRMSLYVPGHSPLHRIAARWKLGALVLCGVGVFLTTSVLVLGPAAALAVVLLVSVRAPVEQLSRQLKGPLVILAVVVAVAALTQSVHSSLVVGLRLVVLLLASLSVTLTTRTSELQGVLEVVLRPLERVGLVNASAIALAVSLALRFIPEVFQQFQDIREAQAARGLRGSPLALVVPLVVRSLKSAEDIAAAIDARCYPPTRSGRAGDSDGGGPTDRHSGKVPG